jgi:hypothetical protein
MRQYIHILFFTVILLGRTCSTIAAPIQTSAVTQYFAVGLQQDGQPIPIENHQAILKKKTFTIVLYFKQPEAVLVNASFSPKSYEQAQADIPLHEIIGFSDLGMAEEAFNPKTLLMVSATAPHYWYYLDDTDHRFNDIIRKDRLLICRRIVAQVMYRDTTRKFVPARDIRENELYLVFMKTEWTQDFSRQVEKQRDYVKILFR